MSSYIKDDGLSSARKISLAWKEFGYEKSQAKKGKG